MSLLDGFFSLGRDINKADSEHLEKKEGVVSDLVPELKLSTKDKDLIKLADKWEKKWDDIKSKDNLDDKQKENEKYWLGNHFENEAQRKKNKRPLVDNIVFESYERFLANVTRQTPEPLVTSVNIKLADSVKKTLIYLADVLKLKLRVRTVVRYWGLYYFAALQIGWSNIKNEMTFINIRPQRMILDPDAFIVGGEYVGEYIGKLRTESAGALIRKFPESTREIKKIVKDKLGTKVSYTEWWTDDMVFYKLKDNILGKSRNPHWNYNQEIEEPMMEMQVDDFGNETEMPVLDGNGTAKVQKRTEKGKNHFKSRKMPFMFISVFTLGKRPYDDTTLIEQVLPLQDLVNKRYKQIDKNADNTNAGAVVSGDAFSKSQAAEVGNALRRGNTVFIPKGDINQAYKRDTGPPLPTFVQENLFDARQELRNIFGVEGLSPSGTKNEKTVRGKIIITRQDIDRNLPIVEYIEQFYDYVFNWMTQMMYIYYDMEHQAEIIGVEDAVEVVTIINSDFVDDLLVSVKEGSLIPKDELTKRNEAVDLWSAGAIDPLELFKKLDFPNPREAALNLFKWQTNPASLFPEVGQTQGVAPSQPVGQLPAEEEPPQENLLSQVPIS